MITGTLITVVPTGSRHTPEQVPALPAGLIDLIVTAKECEALGASVITVHGHGYDRVRQLVSEVRSATDLVVQVGTDSAGTEAEKLELLRSRPDMASLSLGDRPEFVAAAHLAMRRQGIVPGFEATDPAQLALLGELLAEHGGRAHVTLHLDTPEQVYAATAQLPAGVSCTAAGELPVLMTSLALGGHLRVGMADTTAYSPRQAVESNMQLVARAVSFAQLAQRPPLTTKEARELLGVSPR